MAKQYKSIHPAKYYRDYLAHDIRPDSRTLTKFRAVLLNVDSLKTANGSAVIKIGKTIVVCGIKGELTQPRAEEPNKGYIVPNVELPPLCSSKFRPGPPSNQAQVTSRFVADILENFKCIDLTQLCICPDRLVWVLYCDLICLNHDGALADACMVALMTALHTVTLPEVQYEPAIDTKVVLEQNKKSLRIENVPLAVTFAIFDDKIILSDPTSDEENLCSGIVVIVMCGPEKFSIYKPGGTPLSDEQMESCMNLAKKRATKIDALINTTLNTGESES